MVQEDGPAVASVDSIVEVLMDACKHIALIAHDNRKVDLLDWVRFNRDTLAQHALYATGTTGALVYREVGLPVKRFLSGPLGGDQQVGAGIAEGRLDVVSSSGTRSNRRRTTSTSRRCCGWRSSTTVRSPAIAPTADFLLSSPPWASSTTGRALAESCTPPSAPAAPSRSGRRGRSGVRRSGRRRRGQAQRTNNRCGRSTRAMTADVRHGRGADGRSAGR